MAGESALISALNRMDPSQLTYQEFIEVGMALKSEGEPFEAWDDWAKRDPARYKGTLRRKWDGFSGSDSEAAVKGGTIVQMARDRGWERERDLGEALSWDMDSAPAERPSEARVVDPTWVEGAEIDEPGADWEGWKDLERYLRAVFEPGEIVGYVTSSWFDADKGRWLPSGKGPHTETAGEILERIAKHKGDLDSAIGATERPAGAWVRLNPLDGNGVRNENVSEFRHALVESDSLLIEKQVAIIRELRLPVTALVNSGNKSAHAVVRVDARDYGEYRQRVDELYRICRDNGLVVDTQNKNPSRLSRMPGVMRGERKQWLMAVGMGCESWAEWKEWYSDQTDDLPDPESLADVWDDMPQLAPPLISGVLRQGHKMLLAGPSKAGKSYALIELCVAIAEGVPWMGFDVPQRGGVLYVNLELDRASCLHRFRDVYAAMGVPPEHTGNIDVWNLRGKGKPMDELAPSLIRRALKTRPLAVVIDPIYKIITGDENSADQMARFCNQFDLVADSIGCAVVYCHHHSKGVQGGKKSMDRASGSGVFARDPDALLDMVELHMADCDREEMEERFQVDAVCSFMDAEEQLGGWRTLLEPRHLKSAAELRRMAGNFTDNMGLTPALDEAADAARARARSRTAWRIEGTLREFPRFDAVNVWFDWPRHVRDGSGQLAKMFAEGDSSPEALEAGRALGREQRKKNARRMQGLKVSAMREALERCAAAGWKPTRDKVTAMVGEILESEGYELPKTGIKQWTVAAAEWSPIRSRQDDDGVWVLYDTDVEDVTEGWDEGV
ncbi:AAA family ATPase [Parvibacter caecicola]|uniref:AAA family ATPase n=1 Tax=Parvibacter caecicola TaxID=747645 RepID=UPI00249C059D|nr:AAA family ATPase [Parvibacter caecicola]